MKLPWTFRWTQSMARLYTNFSYVTIVHSISWKTVSEYAFTSPNAKLQNWKWYQNGRCTCDNYIVVYLYIKELRHTPFSSSYKKSWHTSFLASYKKYLAYVLFIFPKKIRQIKDAFHFQLRKLYAKTVLIETSNKTCFQLELAKNSRNTKLLAKKTVIPFY